LRHRSACPTWSAAVEELLAFPKCYPLAARWMNRPFVEFLANYVADPAAQRLILSLTGYITDRPETLTVTDMIPIYGYYFHGGVYPEGGSGRLAEVLANVVRDRGGSIRLKSPVRRIQVANGKAAGIELATGERLDAAAVISNADYKRTFLELIDVAHLAADFRSEVERTEPACSAFRVHLAIDFVPDIKPAQNMKSVDGVDLEVVLPSLIDPTAAPTGYATVEMTTLIPHAEALSWFPTTAGEGINSWERFGRLSRAQDRARRSSHRLGRSRHSGSAPAHCLPIRCDARNHGPLRLVHRWCDLWRAHEQALPWQQKPAARPGACGQR
jgi:phytoene dehydrogenase-like protein